MQTTFAVRVRERGQITLPQPARTSLSVNPGDMLNLVQVGDIWLLSTKRPVTPQLAQEFTALMEEESVSLADLLQGLEEERKLIWQERYAGRA